MNSGIAKFHFYEPKLGHRLAHNPLNAIIAPRPIGWISTRDTEGRCNLAPYSFFNAFNYDPPIIGFSGTVLKNRIGPNWKNSIKNAMETKEFVWNLVTMDLAEKMNETAKGVAWGVDEFKLAGLSPVPGRLVNVPRVGESSAAMECKVIDIVQYKDSTGKLIDGWLVLGEVVAVYIDESLIKNGVYQTAYANSIARCGGIDDYVHITENAMFKMRMHANPQNTTTHGV